MAVVCPMVLNARYLNLRITYEASTHYITIAIHISLGLSILTGEKNMLDNIWGKFKCRVLEFCNARLDDYWHIQVQKAYLNLWYLFSEEWMEQDKII